MTVQTFQADPLNGVVAPPVFSASGTSAALEQLAQWVTAAQNAHQLVAPLVSTPFVPDSYRPKVDPRATDEQKRDAYNVAVATGTAAVLQGLSLGLDPLTSLQQIYVVHGRPGMYARIKVALVTSRGHEVWTEDLTDARAVVCGRRKGSQNVERVVITMDQAKRAGWTKNDTYSKTPQDMLYARAAGRVCDRIAPDVLMGIASVEEIADEASVDVQPARTRTVRRAEVGGGERPALPQGGGDIRPNPVAADVARPQPSGPPLPGEEENTVGQPLDERQWAAINREFVRLDVVGDGQKAARLTVISHLVGRPVSAGRELTAPEGQLILDNLAGNNGHEVVASVIGRPEAAPGEPVQEVIGDADPDADTDDAEPSDKEWDGMTGDEVEAEADRG